MKVSGFNNPKAARSELEQYFRDKAAKALRKSRDPEANLSDWYEGMALGYAHASTSVAINCYGTEERTVPEAQQPAYGERVFISQPATKQSVEEMECEGRFHDVSSKRPNPHE